MNLDNTDKELLNLVQADFPLVERPFLALGEEIGIPEAEVMLRTRRLKDENVVRMIGGVFNATSLGYISTLVAMHVPSDRVEEVAAAVSRDSGVSHNYAREHHYNLWFTLTLPETEDMDRAIEALAGRVGVTDFLNLPAEKLFKIDVFFDMLGKRAGPGRTKQAATSAESGPLSEQDRQVIKGLQTDLPLVERPFTQIAGSLGIQPTDFLGAANSLLKRGVMRRYGASLKHREAGFTANAMSCWRVLPGQAEPVGKIMASYKAVSHCYQRRTYGDRWPYSLFGMIHSQTREGCAEVAQGIAEQTGIAEYMLLFSTREFKKQRVRYFSD